jgi:hypothetical protein
MVKIEKKLEQNLNNSEGQEMPSTSPEQKENIEKKPEKVSESEANIDIEKKIDSESKFDRNSSSTVSAQAQGPIANRLKEEIDSILEEGLEDIYLNLPKEVQKEFKAKGEETANKINVLLKETKIKVKKIVQAIVEWLKLAPGINKFFIKQTAKIKTDKILAARDKEFLEK